MTRSGRLAAHWSALAHHPRHGPLPGLLVGLTATTGIVDAVSILSLGRVFVANMTGNVVFVGFALARAPGFSLVASLSALGGFLLGALSGGHVLRIRPRNRAVLLRDALLVELVLVAAATAVAGGVGAPFATPTASGIAFLLACALGLQNAVVRRLAVPDLTTTVLTMTLTGIAADRAEGNAIVFVRRVLAVVTMLLGALGGALLVRDVAPYAGLGVATALLLAIAVAAVRAASAPAEWQGQPS